MVTYDRRGNSRSPLDGEREPQRIEVHGDDAHRVLSAVGVSGDEPASVFGNSSSAIIGRRAAAPRRHRVAERLGTQPVMFPGDHGGFGVQPEAFAVKLRDVLSSS